MDCTESRILLSEYADGALAGAEKAAVEAHLAGCAACRGELAELRRAVAELRELGPAKAPAGFLGRVHERLERPGAAARLAGLEVVLVGDSLGMVKLGYENTLPVTVDDIVYHCRAVRRAGQRFLLVGDMPFMSYGARLDDAVANAGRIVKEGGAEAVKVEGGAEVAETVRALVAAKIPVMGHLGLTPQAIHQLGGYKVQGRGEESAAALVRTALALQEAGVFSLVLECIPVDLALQVTQALAVPTIGIGAGPSCDGQVLVLDDMLGLFSEFRPKFVKRYLNLRPEMLGAVKEYRREVKEGLFPADEHSYRK